MVSEVPSVKLNPSVDSGPKPNPSAPMPTVATPRDAKYATKDGVPWWREPAPEVIMTGQPPVGFGPEGR